MSAIARRSLPGLMPRLTIGLMPGLILGLIGLLLPIWAIAQDFGFEPPRDLHDPNAPAVMRDLAERILPAYQEADTDVYLANLAALQLVTDNYGAAYDTCQVLRDRHPGLAAERLGDCAGLYEIYAHARAIEDDEKIPFAQAFARSFQDVVPKLDNADAAAVMARLESPPLPVSSDAVQKSLARWRAAGSIPLADALDLVRKYVAFEAYGSFGSLIAGLDVEEDRRRYVAEQDLRIRTPAGIVIHAVMVRPNQAAPLPTLLRFTLDPSEDDAKASAAHGYAGVIAYVRGRKSNGRGAVIPFLHDGQDASAVIAWIAKQPWSDGRVGMYGEGYSGFAAWAAARRAPSALKAIATSAPMAPGIDFPMTGEIFRNSAIRWMHEHTSSRPEPVYANEDAKWLALDQIWYRGGKAYRDIDRIFLGKRSPLLQSWLTHPSYDRYWQKMIPYGKQFGRIDLPVLSIAGYDGADTGALYYFTQHIRNDEQADETLLIGPYDEDSIRRGTSPEVDAPIDLRELRYQWFDHVLKNAAKPALLHDRVNYLVMEANEWRHAPSLEAMGSVSLRFYLDTGLDSKPATGQLRLLATASPGSSYREESVNFADRSDAQQVLPIGAGGGIVFKSLPLRNGLAFVGDPLPQSTEFDGRLGGRLDFTPSRQDVDFNVALYELRSNGDYLQLFEPYDFRASYAKDRSHRHLLRAGQRQQLDFIAEHVTSRRLLAGSRLVLVLGVNKRPDREINYGLGEAVSKESIADAGTPLRIRWYGGSFIDVPTPKP